MVGARYGEPLHEIADFAIHHAIESIRQGGQLVPFLVTEAAGRRNVTSVAAESLEDAVAQAKSQVAAARGAVELWALAYDGYLTVDDQQWDAVFVQAGSAGRKILVGQRYRPAGRFRRAEAVGDPALFEPPPD